MEKKFGAFGARQLSLGTLLAADLAPLYFKTRGGGIGGVSHTRTGPGCPPPPPPPGMLSYQMCGSPLTVETQRHQQPMLQLILLW